MTDRELLEYIASQVGALTGKVDRIEKDINELKDGQTRLENTVVGIEQEHGKKLEALVDGYIQNTEQLGRIEKEVSKHEEIILRRVK